MKRVIVAGLTPLLLVALFALTLPQLPSVNAALAAPTLKSPASSSRLTEWTVPLHWTLPDGAAAYHLEVIPFRGEGPGVHLIRPAASGFTIPGPPMWTLLLPDMTYSWRVRSASQFTPSVDDNI